MSFDIFNNYFFREELITRLNNSTSGFIHADVVGNSVVKKCWMNSLGRERIFIYLFQTGKITIEWTHNRKIYAQELRNWGNFKEVSLDLHEISLDFGG